MKHFNDSASSSETEFEPGHKIGERYEVISRLGKGGMGLVYKVNQIFLSKEFALKTIDKNCMSDIAVRRFQHEARTSFALKHPNIVSVYDFGVLEDDTPFLVMELIRGETLGQKIKRTGRLQLEEAMSIFEQSCLALAYAHEQGVVHRDIKPNNIMVLSDVPSGTEGSVKILDFGIAKVAGHECGEIQALTKTGEIFGSPLYMSPEQCIGTKVDARADIYSLGCVFFETLTGTPPLVGRSAMVTMMKHNSEIAPTLKEASLGLDFPQEIETIVARMLAKSPDDRYSDLGAVALDLSAVKQKGQVSHQLKLTPASGQSIEEISISKRRFYTLLLSVALGAVIIAVSVIFALQAFQKKASSSKLEKQAVAINGSKLESVAEPVAVDELIARELPSGELDTILAHPQEEGYIGLDHRKISSDSLVRISKASFVQQLSLSDCQIDNGGLSQLSNLKLKNLRLRESNFDDIGAAQLVACNKINDLNVGSTLITDAGLKSLAKLKSLERLTLSSTKVTDYGLADLLNCKKIGYLDLRDNRQITDSSIRTLVKMDLWWLRLDSTSIDDAGLAILSKIDTLRFVSLGGTKVTKTGVQELCRGNAKLSKVAITLGTGLSQSDVQSLRDEFPGIDFQVE